MKRWMFVVFMFMLGLGDSMSETNKAPINVLIVDGFSNHDWKHTTECIREILEQTPEINVSVSTWSEEKAETWRPAFSEYDVVIQNCNDIKGGERWPREVEVALEQFVKNGGGLYAFHSANNAFPQWDAYNRMIGLGWRNKDFGWALTLDDEGAITRVPAGEGDKTGHGKRRDVVLTRVGEHPIHAGLTRQWVAADIEVYRYARGPAENLTVLSFGEDEKTGLNFPTEWTVLYGEGRMYTSTLGHIWHGEKEDPPGIRCAGIQTLLPRIVQWLAARPVDVSVPEDFPTAETASLRPVRPEE